MGVYRVQVMVGTDVEAESPQAAMAAAIEKVREELGEDASQPMPKPAWVNGIVPCGPEWEHTAIFGYMVFETSMTEVSQR